MVALSILVEPVSKARLFWDIALKYLLDWSKEMLANSATSFRLSVWSLFMTLRRSLIISSEHLRIIVLALLLFLHIRRVRRHKDRTSCELIQFRSCCICRDSLYIWNRKLVCSGLMDFQTSFWTFLYFLDNLIANSMPSLNP